MSRAGDREPGARIEARSSDDQTVNRRSRDPLPGVPGVDTPAVKNAGRARAVAAQGLELVANGLVHRRRVVRRRILTRTDCPNGFVCNGDWAMHELSHARKAGAQLPFDRRFSFARFALLERFANA